MDNLVEDIQSTAQGNVLYLVIIACVCLLITAPVSHFITRFIRHATSSDEVQVPSSSIIVNIVRVIVWGVGICAVLALFGVDITALIAALGIGGIALSLGLKDTIANLLGGIQATVLKIVHPGDSITVAGVSGIVQDVTWRQTEVVDIDNIVHIIPNATINSAVVSKVAQNSLVVVPFSTMGTCTDPEKLARDMESAAKPAIEAVGQLARDPWVLFTDVGDYGVHGKLRFVMEKPQNLREARDAAMRAISPLLGNN
ncbi:MAG: mechanosensitive ion channel [Eggerthellaceae bacterium]|nr:mechanosensitive ion channel [Eggerthellaceae bacterium]